MTLETTRHMFSETRINTRKLRAMIIGVAVIIAIAVILVSSVQFVPAGYRGVLLHWQAVDMGIGSLNEGIHFVVPVQDHIESIETRVKGFAQEASSASKDLQIVSTTVTVNYHLSPDKVHQIYKNIGLEYENRVILPAIQETVKQVTAQFDAEDLIRQRPLVKSDIEQSLRERLVNFDIVTDVVSITEFHFSPEFAKAIEEKVTAQQNALTSQNIVRIREAEARQAVAIAEGQANSTIKVAEGAKQATILQAQGEATAIIIRAEAESQKIKLITEFLQQNPTYLDWLRTIQWNGKLPDTLISGNGAFPFIQVPTHATEQEPQKVE